MSIIDCQPDGSCPYQYACIDNACQHDTVFPIFGYPIAIYCLFPFATAICNISGTSMGQFKVLFLMDGLNYSEAASTILSYPLILGAALFNAFELVPKRHPSRPTSMIDYNLLAIILPSSLYGSMVGALINRLIPPIVADACIIVLFGYFSYKFFMKVRDLIKQQKKLEGEKETSNELPLLSEEQKQDAEKRARGITEANVDKPVVEQTAQPNSEPRLDSSKLPQSRQVVAVADPSQKSDKPGSSDRKDESAEKEAEKSEKEAELAQLMKYEATHHFPHIVVIVVAFIIFEVLSALAQGKIVKFDTCSKWEIIGLVLFTAFYLSSLVAIYWLYTRPQLARYKRLGYQYDYALDNSKYFLLICLGSFAGGLNGGAFAMANNITIIFALVHLNFEPMVASATCGFQIVFSGAASLVEAIIRGEIRMQVVGFFFGLTFVGGGIITFTANRLMKGFNRVKVNKVIMSVIACSTALSTLSLVVNIVLSYRNFGSAYMISSQDFCT